MEGGLPGTDAAVPRVPRDERRAVEGEVPPGAAAPSEVSAVVRLETTFLIDLLNAVPAAVSRAKALEAAGEVRCVTAPTAAELLIGAHYLGGADLARAGELIDSLVLLDFDRQACHEAGQIGVDLLARGEALAATDLFIAAISKRHGHRLLTRDRLFARVRGLTVETY